MQDFPPFAYHYEISHEILTLASIIQFPPEKKVESYADLVCTSADQNNIHEIITLMSEHGKLGLLAKKNHLRSLGAQINHVHPLKFLSTIVSDPHLRACLFDIFGDYFKRNGFMDGIGPSLSREANKGELNRYIGDFAKEVGVSTESITEYFEKQNWEGLVRVFLQTESLTPDM